MGAVHVSTLAASPVDKKPLRARPIFPMIIIGTFCRFLPLEISSIFNFFK
jgi:hypothetical protein